MANPTPYKPKLGFTFKLGIPISQLLSKPTVKIPYSELSVNELENFYDLPQGSDYYNYVTAWVAYEAGNWWNPGYDDTENSPGQKTRESWENQIKRMNKQGLTQQYVNDYENNKKSRKEREEAERRKKEEEEKKNAQQSIIQGQGYFDNKPTGNENIITLSYPSKPSTEEKTGKKLGREHNDDYRMLFDNGCYYFKLSYAPNYNLRDDMKLKIQDDLYNKLTSLFEQGLNGLTSMLKKAGGYAANVIAEYVDKGVGAATDASIQNAVDNIHMNVTDYIIGEQAKHFAIQRAAKTVLEAEKSELKSGSEGLMKTFNDTFISLYNNQTLQTAIIFLPLNSMTIKRESGVGGQEGVMKSIMQKKIIDEYQSVEKKTGTAGAMTGSGYSDNKFRGITTSGANFENYSFEWNMMPKNEAEMKEILNILVYFQCACISNLNLNDRSNMKWILPPVCEFGIMTSDFGSGSWYKNMIKGYSFNDIRNNRNFSSDIEWQNKQWGNKNGKNYMAQNDLYKEGVENTRLLSPDTLSLENVSNVRWLKKPVSVYIKNVSIDPLMNDGGVLLSPEGFPMGVKLKVDVMRTVLASLDDLWDGNNEEKKRGSLSNANPFA